MWLLRQRPVSFSPYFELSVSSNQAKQWCAPRRVERMHLPFDV